MPTPIKWGSEGLVNTTAIGSDAEPNITTFSDGKYLITWLVNDVSVMAQLFNANGSANGAEFLIGETSPLFGSIEHSLASLSNDRFIAVWVGSEIGNDDESPIQAQIFNADGTPAGVEFLVNSTTNSYQHSPAIIALSNGKFVITWEDFSVSSGGDNEFSYIRAQMYNGDGTTSGSEFQVSSTSGIDNRTPDITALAAGRFLVTWQQHPVADYENPEINTDGDIIGQIFNADGSKAGGEFGINATVSDDQSNPSVSTLSSGRFVITWTDDSQTGTDTDGNAVRAQVFNADGSVSGNEFLINTTVTNAQKDAEIVALFDGRFVVAWVDDSLTGSDASSSAIRAQVFNADGTKSGSEFLVNTTTNNAQTNPSIAELSDGRIVVTWEDASDPLNLAVRTQIFDLSTSGRTFNGTTGNDVLIGTVFDDFIYGLSGDDIIDSAAGDDRVYDGRGDDVVHAGSGNDYVRAGGGVDEYHGGAGVDYISYYDSTGGVRLYLGGNVISHGWANNDIISGFEGASGSKTGGDILDGSTANNLFRGYGGNDVLSGREGDDILFGGADSDNLHGGSGNDKLYGGSGNDSLYGSVGDDYLKGHSGIDDLYGGSGSDRLRGGSGNDILDGGTGDDLLEGDDGYDQLRGGEGEDYLYGGEGNDSMHGGEGDDYLYGNIGNDTLAGGDGNDILFAGAGDDVLYGGEGNNKLYGGSGNDELYGGYNDDYLKGHSGNDYLNGEYGNDRLRGSDGNDILTGSFGDDTFIFDVSWDDDIVSDFNIFGNDKLDFSRIAAITQISDLTITYGLYDTLISFGSDSITLTYSTATLLADDFVF